MRVMLTGCTGVLGQVLAPRLRGAGHEVYGPAHDEIDIFDLNQVRGALSKAEATFHLATRIPRSGQGDPEAWWENDRLRDEATSILVEAALEVGVEHFVFPSIAFVYPSSGPVDESTPLRDDMPFFVRSALSAEHHVSQFASNGRHGVVLRLGLIYGPGTGSKQPVERYRSFGATLQIDDAADALLAALVAPSGIYNVVSDGERISNSRFKRSTGWRPKHALASKKGA